MAIIKRIVNTIFSTTKKVNKSNTCEFGDNYIRSSQKICPYCSSILVKVVKAKTKCPNCGKYIYSRTHPYTKEKLSLTKLQTDEVELEWAKINGTYDELIKHREEFQSIKNILSKRFGSPASDSDVEWGLLNKQLSDGMRTSDWYMMGKAYLAMGVICFKEKRYRDCIIDYCLCSNCELRELYKNYNKLQMEVTDSIKKSYIILNTVPVRESLKVLNCENEIENIASIVEDMSLQPSEMIKQVDLILGTHDKIASSIN